ncbi:MAG: hypothetical protein KJN95_00335 [Gammaproteobacteria bacterium]|nr:hypothetical protein [Gammaproteobacteria bacterium]
MFNFDVTATRKAGVYIAGGVPLTRPVNFVSGYLTQVFAFIGIIDVNIGGADPMNVDARASFVRARSDIEQEYVANAAQE